MAFVIYDWEFYGVIAFYIFGKIISRFGGMRIAYYRSRKIPFFAYAIKDPGKERHLHVKRMTALVHHSPLGFTDDEGALRFWPEPENLEDCIDRYCGGPFLEYRHDDARPMPISKHDGQLMNPQHLIKPYMNKSSTDLNRIGVKTSRAETLTRLLVLFSLLGTMAILYYTILYDQNIACAVHASGVCG